MASITMTIAPSVKGDTFQYTVKIGDKDPVGPVTPSAVEDSNRTVVNSVTFGVTLGDRLIFESDKPFTLFFRYGRPDRGDYNSTDEEKQTRSQLTQDKDGDPIHRTSFWALLVGLYEPVVILIDGDNFIYDRGLGFEVRPAGA